MGIEMRDFFLPHIQNCCAFKRAENSWEGSISCPRGSKEISSDKKDITSTPNRSLSKPAIFSGLHLHHALK